MLKSKKTKSFQDEHLSNTMISANKALEGVVAFSIPSSLNTLKLTLILLSIMSVIFFVSPSFTFKNAEARCPNGYHKSPSGGCETFIPHTGLPRCPNGHHRGPAGECELVSNDGSGGAVTIPQNNSSNSNTVTPPIKSSPSSSGAATTTTSISNGCDQSLWDHVYNPSRLHVVDSCKTVTGIIESVRKEADGDFHIRLKLDSQFSNLINSANIKGQYGDMVVEPICVNRVTQADAISSCQNFRQNIVIPPVGNHVEITGSYVLDKEHGGWAEIHPVTSIKSL
jgi:hypothetical protein